MVAPGIEVPVAGAGVFVGGMSVGTSAVAIVGNGEAVRAGNGVRVEMGSVGTVPVIPGLASLVLGTVPVRLGWDVSVGS